MSLAVFLRETSQIMLNSIFVFKVGISYLKQKSTQYVNKQLHKSRHKALNFDYILFREGYGNEENNWFSACLQHVFQEVVTTVAVSSNLHTKVRSSVQKWQSCKHVIVDPICCSFTGSIQSPKGKIFFKVNLLKLYQLILDMSSLCNLTNRHTDTVLLCKSPKPLDVQNIYWTEILLLQN